MNPVSFTITLICIVILIIIILFKFYKFMEIVEKKAAIDHINRKVALINENCGKGDPDSLRMFSQILVLMSLHGIEQSEISHNLPTVEMWAKNSFQKAIDGVGAKQEILLEEMDGLKLNDGENESSRKVELWYELRRLHTLQKGMEYELQQFSVE